MIYLNTFRSVKEFFFLVQQIEQKWPLIKKLYNWIKKKKSFEYNSHLQRIINVNSVRSWAKEEARKKSSPFEECIAVVKCNLSYSFLFVIASFPFCIIQCLHRTLFLHLCFFFFFIAIKLIMIQMIMTMQKLLAIGNGYSSYTQIQYRKLY